MKQKKWVLFSALLIGIVAVLFLILPDRKGAGGKQAPPAQGGPPAFAMPVEVAPVKVGPTVETVSAVGNLQANESVMIRPEVAGVVKKVNFQEGQPVVGGKVLIELDDAELKAQLAQADAAAEIARLNHDRMQKLIVNDNVSRQEVDQAMTGLKSADANSSLFKTRLDKTKIRAPFAGYLGIRRFSPGDFVQPGRDLVNLEDIATLKVDFNIPESFFSRLAIGQKIEIRVEALAGQRFEGEVYALDPRADEVSRTIRVRARIPNPKARLLPGMFANVKLILGHTDKALLIPEEAVVPQQGKMFVFRVVDNTARWTEVSLGAREQGMVQVITGLAETDSVVKAGLQKIRDGAPVQVVKGGNPT